jgi:hypothetical protein
VSIFRGRLTRSSTSARTDKPIWFGRQVCGEGNNHVSMGNEHYFHSGNGLLMPTKKDQPPPDLRYFRTCNR